MPFYVFCLSIYIRDVPATEEIPVLQGQKEILVRRATKVHAALRETKVRRDQLGHLAFLEQMVSMGMIVLLNWFKTKRLILHFWFRPSGTLLTVSPYFH